MKFTQPIAPGGLCWHCDHRLFAGGRVYKLRLVDGVLRPVHVSCAREIDRGRAR